MNNIGFYVLTLPPTHLYVCEISVVLELLCPRSFPNISRYVQTPNKCVASLCPANANMPRSR